MSVTTLLHTQTVVPFFCLSKSWNTSCVIRIHIVLSRNFGEAQWLLSAFLCFFCSSLRYSSLPPSFCLSFSFTLTCSASGLCEHRYAEAMLNNKSIAPCDRRALQGNMHTIHNYTYPSIQWEWGTLPEGNNLFLSVGTFVLFSLQVFTWKSLTNLHTFT